MLEINSNVEIRPLSRENAEKTFSWLQKSVVRENIGLRSEPSLEKTFEWIKNAEKSESIYPFAIEVAGNHVGNVILDKYDDYLAASRFSIYIGESDLYNSGIGRAATYKICKFGFEELSLNKIWLTVHARNFRAINSYIKVGFRLEGVLRDEFLLDNKRIDAFYMGMLRSDFAKIEILFT